MDFRSDNTHGCSPEIVEALVRANRGTMTSYGDDAVTARLRDRCCELFACEVDVFPVLTGTAANALAIASMTTRDSRIVCHSEAHIHLEELGAAEFLSGGAKLVPVAGAEGKLSDKDVAPAGDFDCLSITQATEAGTLYSLDDLASLGGLGHARGTGIHMDGARFANAVAALGCAPADLTRRVGVDVLSFGATKNGAMGAEMIVVFRKDLAENLARLWHRSGHRLSKSRFLSAQLEAYLTDDLWLRNARHANAAAARLADGIRGHVEIVQPVEVNVLFVRMDDSRAAALRAQGFSFYDWELFGAGVRRLVTAFDSTDAEIDSFIAAIQQSSQA
ncbi:MAG TPA: beta-eliminating lyase-related protein [Thermoanaerobaculia bacterium]|jgi:threonine aldolase|nr:beta-eliminating lyase-related protein [Thermoanaerobaculia bacterium]